MFFHHRPMQHKIQYPCVSINQKMYTIGEKNNSIIGSHSFNDLRKPIEQFYNFQHRCISQYYPNDRHKSEYDHRASMQTFVPSMASHPTSPKVVEQPTVHTFVKFDTNHILLSYQCCIGFKRKRSRSRGGELRQPTMTSRHSTHVDRHQRVRSTSQISISANEPRVI
jgi:hypothetical protein